MSDNQLEDIKMFMMLNFEEDDDKLEAIFDGIKSIHQINLYDLIDIHDMLFDRIKIFDYISNMYERQIDEYHEDYFDKKTAETMCTIIKNEVQNKLQERKQNINMEKKKCYKWANQLDVENEMGDLTREEEYIEELLHVL